jgi:hypothetical protein
MKDAFSILARVGVCVVVVVVVVAVKLAIRSM